MFTSTYSEVKLSCWDLHPDLTTRPVSSAVFRGLKQIQSCLVLSLLLVLAKLKTHWLVFSFALFVICHFILITNLLYIIYWWWMGDLWTKSVTLNISIMTELHSLWCLVFVLLKTLLWERQNSLVMGNHVFPRAYYIRALRAPVPCTKLPPFHPLVSWRKTWPKYKRQSLI